MLQPRKHLSPRGRDKSVPRSCYIHQLVSVRVADNQRVNADSLSKIIAFKGNLDYGGEGGTPTPEICRHLSSTVVWKPA
jgi:hypothetical protein